MKALALCLAVALAAAACILSPAVIAGCGDTRDEVTAHPLEAEADAPPACPSAAVFLPDATTDDLDAGPPPTTLDAATLPHGPCALLDGRVVAIGDSLTAMYSTYPRHLAERIGRDVEVAGTGGLMCDQMPQLVGQYAYVVLGCGTNDLLKGHTAAEIIAAIDRQAVLLKAHTRVLVVIPIPQLKGDYSAIRKVVNEHLHVTYWSPPITYDVWMGDVADAADKTLYFDGIHHTDAGYDHRAWYCEREITRCR